MMHKQLRPTSADIFRLFAAVLVAGAVTGPASAQNRFAIESLTVPVNSTGVEVAVLATVEKDLYGFSISVEYDPAKIRITDVQLGADVAALEPDVDGWHGGSTNNTTGRLVYGVVFSISQDTAEKHLAPGSDYEVLKLTVDIQATTDTETLLDLVDRKTENPVRVNVMSDGNGDSFKPGPLLDDGQIVIRNLAPTISGFELNEGDVGQMFFIVGSNFDQPDTTVKVCNKEVAATLLPSGDLQVVAPECGPGPAPVEVCNTFGCDSEPNGFMYPTLPDAPTITEFLFNEGQAGQTFFVVGTDFDTAPGLVVRVCDVEAPFELQGNGQQIQVTAPECGQGGCVKVEVCTDAGCDFDEQGFCYLGTPFIRGDVNHSNNVDLSDGVAIFNDLFQGQPAKAPCRDALDANDSGVVDISDGIFILNFLFQGGDPIPLPYPAAGLDPTPDDLAGC